MMKIMGMGFPEISIVFVIILALALAVIPARIAAGKGYSYWGFYAFGVFFFVVALVVALLMKDNGEGEGAKGPTPQDLLAYKQLLDAGAITQEEFDAKKAELFNITR